MKRNYIVKTKYTVVFLALLLAMAGIGACKQKKKVERAATAEVTDHTRADTSLNYLLKPVNARVIASIPVIRASKGPAVYIRELSGRIAYDTRQQVSLSARVSGRIEKLYVKYNYQPIKKGELILTLYSADLAAAQRELLLIGKSVAAGAAQQEDVYLLNAAKQKLMLLGMSAAQVNKVLRTGQVNYTIPVYSNATGYILEQAGTPAPTPAPSPVGSAAASGAMDNMGAAGSSATNTATTGSTATTAVMLREGQYLNAGQRIFSIYQSSAVVAEFFLPPAEAAQLSKEAKVIIQHLAEQPGDSKETFTGKIGLIQPVINAGENFVLARVYLNQQGLKVGELVTGQLPLMTATAYWLPEEAVLSLGNQAVVFRKEGKYFVPQPVKTGVTQNHLVQILGDIHDWDVAKNSSYLVDSESFIKIKNERD